MQSFRADLDKHRSDVATMFDGVARRYDLLITSDGRLDVNGTDIMPLVPGLLR